MSHKKFALSLKMHCYYNNFIKIRFQHIVGNLSLLIRETNKEIQAQMHISVLIGLTTNITITYPTLILTYQLEGQILLYHCLVKQLYLDYFVRNALV